MNAQKFFASVTIVAAMLAGFAAHGASLAANPDMPQAAHVLPRTSIDPIWYEFDRGDEGPQSAPEKPFAVQASKPQPKRETAVAWRCGAPRGLANDETQTVKVCEWEPVR